MNERKIDEAMILFSTNAEGLLDVDRIGVSEPFELKQVQGYNL